jgi:hypothetical protein
MSQYRLYCVGESGNCYKVALMLELCGCAWQPVFVDYFAREPVHVGCDGREERAVRVRPYTPERPHEFPCVRFASPRDARNEREEANADLHGCG